MAFSRAVSSRKRKQEIEAPFGVDVLPLTSGVGPAFGMYSLCKCPSLTCTDVELHSQLSCYPPGQQDAIPTV